jgi:TPR repeat protein
MNYYNYRGYYATNPREFLKEYRNGNLCIFYSKKDGAKLIKDLPSLIDKSSDIDMYAYAYALYKFGDINDKHRAFKIVNDLVEKKFVPAYNIYGLTLFEGYVVTKSEKGAFDWFKEASDEGFIISRHNLALCYLNGNGVAKDVARGMALLEECAEEGYHLSLNSIATVYYKGINGYPQDYSKAYYYYNKASLYYDGKAAFAVAVMHEKGLGCEKSKQKAFLNYQFAAGLDHVYSQLITGEWLLFGTHGEKNVDSACAFLTDAANNGNELAMYYLGAGSLDGTFWWIDKSDGKEWLKKAAKLGQEDAIALVKKLKL